MAENKRFQVRDSEEELKKLKEAVKKLGFKDTADWYRSVKRETIQKANRVSIEFDSSDLTTLVIAKSLAQTRLQNLINGLQDKEQIEALKNQMQEIDKVFESIEKLHDDKIYFEFEEE